MSENQSPPSENSSAPPPPPPSPPPTTPPPPPPSGGPSATGGGDSSNRSVMIILSYLWILALIPFLVEKEDREVQWHAKHGLVLTGAELILWIVLTILNIVSSAIFAPIGCLFIILSIVLGIGILGLHVMCMVKGVNGERLLVPGVSEFADRF